MPKKSARKRARQSEPEPVPQAQDAAAQVAMLQSELADVRALFARALNWQTAGELYHDLIDSFNSSGSRYRCDRTDNWLWRGYMSVDHCMAVQMCQGTLRGRGTGKLLYKGEMALFVLERLRTQNACKEAVKMLLKEFDGQAHGYGLKHNVNTY